MLTAGKTNIGWVCLDELVRERGPRQQAPRRLIFLSFNLLPTVSLGVSSIRGCGRATKSEGCRWGGGQPFQALPSGEWLWPRRGQKHQWNRWNVLLWNCLQSFVLLGFKVLSVSQYVFDFCMKLSIPNSFAVFPLMSASFISVSKMYLSEISAALAAFCLVCESRLIAGFMLKTCDPAKNITSKHYVPSTMLFCFVFFHLASDLGHIHHATKSGFSSR